MENMHQWIHAAAISIEVFAVLVIVTCTIFASAQWLYRSVTNIEKAYLSYREVLGKTLLVGLELLLAADVIRTVALDFTLDNILNLGVLVLVRTFLSWTLNVEVEGRWPWQSKQKEKTSAGKLMEEVRVES